MGVARFDPFRSTYTHDPGVGGVDWVAKFLATRAIICRYAEVGRETSRWFWDGVDNLISFVYTPPTMLNSKIPMSGR